MCLRTLNCGSFFYLKVKLLNECRQCKINGSHTGPSWLCLLPVSSQPHRARFSKAMVVSAAKVCGSSEHCWRIRMTHWPTLVSSCGKFCSFLQNESSNPTLDGSQLRSSHSRAALRSPSPVICHSTQSTWGLLMPTGC